MSVRDDCLKDRDELQAKLNEVDGEGRRLLGRIAHNMEGQPGAASYDGGRGGPPGSTHSDPTAAAVEVIDKRGDPARDDYYRLLNLLNLLKTVPASWPKKRGWLHEAIIIADQYPAHGKPPTDKDKRESSTGGPVCASPHRYSERSVTNGPSTVGGRLDVPRLNCRWCKDQIIKTGKVPTKREVEDYDQRETGPTRNRRPSTT